MKQTLKRLAPWAFVLVILAGLAAVHGLDANFDSSYEIMNGDFQNYNPVRHLLAGQAPYKDFAVYLGAGELYSVGTLLLVLGNSFGRSIFATNFCTWFYFELLVLAACLVVLGRGRRAAAVCPALCAWFLLIAHDVKVPLYTQVRPLIEYAARNGNSARMMRGAALTLAVLLILLGLWLFARRCHTGRGRAVPPWVLVPAVAGFLVPWSNDMGAAMYLSVALGYGLFLLRQYGTAWKQVLLRVGQYILISCVALGVSVLLISYGHPIAWLQQTRGVSAFQGWYYGTSAQGKLCYLTDYIPQPAGAVCLVLAVLFAVGIFRCRTARSAVLAAAGFALCLGMPLWNLLYCILSGSREGGPTGGAQALLAVMVPLFVLRVLLDLARRPLNSRRKYGRLAALGAQGLCALLACGVLAVGLATQVQSRLGGHGDLTYVPELGGWFGDQADKLATEKSMNEGKTLFGTYSSALEAMTGQLQPTGVDYIIHAMGDRQRLAYLTAFQTGSFDRVVTPSAKVALSERWSRNANWWFYRELYRWWAPVANTFNSGGMHLFWERTGVCNDLAQPCTVDLDQDGKTVTVTVTADDPTFCGVADVTLNYTFTVDSGFALRGGLHSFLFCTPVTENQLCEAAGRDPDQGNFFLPTDRGTYNVPVTISDGTGVITLEALPQDAASVTVDSATVEATYFDWEYFFE